MHGSLKAVEKSFVVQIGVQEDFQTRVGMNVRFVLLISVYNAQKNDYNLHICRMIQKRLSLA
jgi:hypothetical protein